jgi:hypothetical protein
MLSLGLQAHPTFKKCEAAKLHFTGRLETAEYRCNLAHKTWLTPEHPLMERWDVVLGLLLVLHVALLTPYEVALLEHAAAGGGGVDALWLLNRAVDCAFLYDIRLNFALAYFDDGGSRGGGGGGGGSGGGGSGGGGNPPTRMWVLNRYRIRRHYLRGWFAVDLLSILLPLGELTLASSASSGGAAAGGGGSGSTALSSLRAARMLKLLKLTRLLRVARATRTFGRIRQRLNLSFATLLQVRRVGLVAPTI